MGLMDFFRRSGPNAAAAQGARHEPPLAASGQQVQSESQWRGFVSPGIPVTNAGVRVDEGTALGLPATLQALRVLTGVAAMTPLLYYSRGENGRSRADSDPLWGLLHDRPNGVQTAFEFFELLYADLMLAGNHYAYVSRDVTGRVNALTRLAPGTVSIAEYFDRADGVTLFYDATLPDGTSERFAARDIWHLRGFSRDGIHGLNPIAYARDALGGAVATARHTNRFWARGGKVDTVLQTKAKVSPEDRTRIRNDWTQLHANPDGHSVAVLDQDLTAQFLSHDNQKSQFVETRQFQVVDLARIWGVPPHLIFDLSRSTFSNIEQQSLEFVIYHLGPHFRRVGQSATRQFAQEGHYFEHLTDALVRGDLKSRMEAYWLERQMGMSNANELRRRDNQPEIPGKAGEEYWRPANMGVAGEDFVPRGALPRERVDGE